MEDGKEFTWEFAWPDDIFIWNIDKQCFYYAQTEKHIFIADQNDAYDLGHGTIFDRDFQPVGTFKFRDGRTYRHWFDKSMKGVREPWVEDERKIKITISQMARMYKNLHTDTRVYMETEDNIYISTRPETSYGDGFGKIYTKQWKWTGYFYYSKKENLFIVDLNNQPRVKTPYIKSPFMDE